MGSPEAAGGKVKKMHLKGERERQVDVAKALLPALKSFKRPPRFAGVKMGGLRTHQTPTGIRQIAVRGSLG